MSKNLYDTQVRNDGKFPRLLKRWSPLLVLAFLIIAAYLSGVHEALSLESLQDKKITFQAFAKTHPFSSVFLFVALYTACVALSLPIATLLTLLGGFVFGAWLGTLYVVIGATIGATIVFLIARTSLGRTLRDKAGAIYQKIENNMQDNATGYMLFMRLVPIFPFFLVNIVPALFNVSTRSYVLTTFIGIIPGTFVYVNLGKELGAIDNLADLVSGKTLLAFALLGLFALIPTLYKQIRSRMQLNKKVKENNG